MSRPRTIRKHIWAALTDDLLLKLISLLAALLIYSFVHTTENAQRTLSVALIADMPPASAKRQLMTQLPTTFSVTVRGSRGPIDALRTENMDPIALNLTDGHLNRYEILSSMIRIPPGVEVERIVPVVIELHWEDVITREIQVQATRAGEPAPGFVVAGETGVEPKSILATGAASEVSVIQFARADAFQVHGLGEGQYVRTLALDRPPRFVGYNITSVEATLLIERRRVTKEFARLAVEPVGIKHATVRPRTVDVLVTGAPEKVEPLIADAIVPRVEPKLVGADLSKSDSMMLDVLVNIPDLHVEVRPSKVFVKW